MPVRKSRLPDCTASTYVPNGSGGAGRLIPSSFNRCSALRLRFFMGYHLVACLPRDLAHIVSEPILDIPRLVEAAGHQRFDSILGGGAPERSLFAAGETHVAGERDLTAVARRTSADEGDGDDRHAGQTHEKVRPRRQACRTSRHCGQVLELG